MTLCVGDRREKEPWAAPVYYLYVPPDVSPGESHGFYFFSNPDSRHISKGLGHLCAAAIFKDDPLPKNLEGVQMSGTVKKCPADPGSAKIALRYAKRFEITSSTEKILSYFKTKFHARLYCFIPDSMYYMDNKAGFGTREKIDL